MLTPNRIAAIAAVAAFVVALLVTSAFGNRYLRSIDRREAHVIALNRQANASLDRLQPKVARLAPTNAKAAVMTFGLTGTNRTLTRMERGVALLERRISALSRGLAETQATLGGVGSSVTTISGGIGRVNSGLGATAAGVGGIALDVAATRSTLAAFPAALGATSSRLAYVNSVVGLLGDAGVSSDIVLTVRINKAKIGTATIRATIIPRATWRLP